MTAGKHLNNLNRFKNQQMKFYLHSTPLFILLVVGIGIGCQSKKSEPVKVTYTDADSLTAKYLNFEDSILMAWNVMIDDDNKKIKAMWNLVTEIKNSGTHNADQIKSLEQRIKQLKEIRYTPKNMGNADIIDEYDFATNSLVSEILTLTESHPQFSSNSNLQKLADFIRMADQRIENYRISYDDIVKRYNSFIDENHDRLKEINITGTVEKKPLFQAAYD